MGHLRAFTRYVDLRREYLEISSSQSLAVYIILVSNLGPSTEATGSPKRHRSASDHRRTKLVIV